MKIGLRLKFAVFFILFCACMLGGFYYMIREFAFDFFLGSYQESVEKIIDTAAYGLKLSPEEIHTYAGTRKEDTRYGQILMDLNQIKILADLDYLYMLYPTGADTAVWLFDAPGEETDEGFQNLGDEVSDYTEESFDKLRVVAASEADSSSDITQTELGTLVSVYVPIRDEEGRTIAVLGADKSLEILVSQMNAQIQNISRQILILLAAGTVLLLLYVQIGVIRSVRRLKSGVLKMAEGELGTYIDVKRRDEIGDITRVFNRMSANIEGHVREMEELNKGYHKFVPSPMFEILHKNSVVDLKLGDQAKTELTVLSLRSGEFSEKTRGLSSEETFRYINQVFAQCIPAVMKEGGTIERFEEAGFRSFYSGSTENALKAAVSVCETMHHTGQSLSAGIAFGSIMLGAAGHEERMDMVSISEQTSFSGFLMDMAQKYHACILISQTAAEQIPDIEKFYHIRFLGYIGFSGSGEREKVFDVFDGDLPGDRKLKRMTKDVFSRGTKLFLEGDYESARLAFVEVLKQYRKDGAAREYLYLCTRYMQEKPQIGFEDCLEVF